MVFLGPTLTEAEAKKIVDAVILPPAAQGSIVRAVIRYHPSAIVIIDGTFQGEPAVRHKEILWALSRGIPVLGAASMGALRAAELSPHMQGIGLVYRWYRRFAFAPDDAVAVLHGPPDLGSRPFTIAEVDLRMTFRAAERRGAITRDERLRLAAAAAQLNFRDRTIARVAERVAAEGHRRAAEWTALLSASLVEQKKRDAVQALELVKRCGLPKPHRVPFTMTAAFARDLEDAGIDAASVVGREAP
jgi:hypothetical protein